MMERGSRKLLFGVIASALGLVGVLLRLAGPTFPAGAQGSRVVQLWPDRSVGVASGLLEGATAYTATQVFPFGVSRTSAGDVVRARTYLHFPLDVFPPGAEILRAALYVYVDSGSGVGEGMLGAYRVLESWEEGDWGDDPLAWPSLLTSPVAVTTARFDVVTSTLSVLPVSTPVLTATPTVASTPALTATETSLLLSKPAGHSLDESTVVIIDPSTGQVDVGATTTVDIRIKNVTDLDYAEVYLTFDPALLEVVDADPGVGGVQIQPGVFLDPDSAEENIFCNIVYQDDGEQDGGEICFSQITPDEPVSGSGVLAVITFRGKAVGESGINFDEESSYLEDYDGELISTGFQDGSVTVTSGENPVPTAEPTYTSPSSPLPTPTSASTPGPTPTSPTSPLPTPTSAPTPSPTPTSPASSMPTPASSPSPTVPVLPLGRVAGTWLTWDVTALMRAWLAGEVPDDGLALALAPDPNAGSDTAGDLLVAHWLSAENPGTKPYLVAEFKVHPVTPAPTSMPMPVLPSAGSPVGWWAAGLLLVGAALLVLGLIGWRK